MMVGGIRRWWGVVEGCKGTEPLATNVAICTSRHSALDRSLTDLGVDKAVLKLDSWNDSCHQSRLPGLQELLITSSRDSSAVRLTRGYA